MASDLEGILVVSLEQAVAAPLAARNLADAGARVIKVERPEGDFARGYDHYCEGESVNFVWLNRGKESLRLDLKDATDMALLLRMLARADVFIQNLAPGATGRLGIGAATLRQRFPRLITCDISGYGATGPFRDLKAYDLLVQAESGLASVNGIGDEFDACRHLRVRHRGRHDGDLGTLLCALRARAHRPGTGHRGLSLSRDRRLDERALPHLGLWPARAAPSRPPSPDDSALRRLSLR